MKYLIVMLTLVLAGCTSETDNSSKLRSELQESQLNLQSCQSSLDVYRGGTSSNESTPQQEATQEPEQPTEPRYVTIDAYHITTKLGSTVCYERNNSQNDENSEDLACGMTFSECKDGYIYRCMTDVKYKIVKEQTLAE